MKKPTNAVHVFDLNPEEMRVSGVPVTVALRDDDFQVVGSVHAVLSVEEMREAVKVWDAAWKAKLDAVNSAFTDVPDEIKLWKDGVEGN